MIRSPICVVLGHVDHGKTKILDSIRGSAIASKEAGGITQSIGASIIPLTTIKEICGELLKTLKMEFTIPGILFVDSPGHAAFTSLRKRGGNIADIAILVIDINEGVMPQTLESIEILKQYKTPFIIAANKIDLIQGWQEKKGNLIEQINSQTENIKTMLDKKMYELVGKLAELNFNAERFDRVDDYTKQVAIIPTSAKKSIGIAELLMVLTGLAQKYLEQSLKLDTKGDAKGTILEVKEETGLGKTIDVILYDGNLKQNNIIVIGALDKPITTKVKALLEPLPLEEMRDKKSKFKKVKQVNAATGVKIAALGLDNAVAGMPIRNCNKQNLEKVKREIQLEVEEVLFETKKDGIIIKADSLGSLEALIKLLKEKDIKIRKASIGNITKKDITDAESNYEKDPLLSVILGFNVKDDSGICKDEVKIITNDIIYKIIEDYEKWISSYKKELEAKELKDLVKPAKIEIMKGYVFRQNNPAIIGVHIVEGSIRTDIPLMKKDGKEIATVKSIQLDQENIEKAEKNQQVAISLPGVTVGRQIKEGDILYSSIPENDFRKLKELKKYLKKEELSLMKEIAEIMRKKNPVWGV